MPHGWWPLLKKTANGWMQHEGLRLAASLAFYTLLSMAPLVILTIAIASLAFGRPAAQQAVVEQVRTMMGPDGARAIQTIIQYGKAPHTDSVASVIGIVVLLFGASSVFGELQSALNKVWDADASAASGVVALIKSRLFSFAMVLALGFLLLVSLLVSAGLMALGAYFKARLALGPAVIASLNEAVSLVVTTFMLALLFRYVPDRRIDWRDVWVGAVVTALLFTAGKALLGLYLGKVAVGSAYGTAGSLVVLIVWVYYSAVIFYFGAEFTHANWCRRRDAEAIRAQC